MDLYGIYDVGTKTEERLMIISSRYGSYLTSFVTRSCKLVVIK